VIEFDLAKPDRYTLEQNEDGTDRLVMEWNVASGEAFKLLKVLYRQEVPTGESRY
jgi:hypothetical protein